MSDTDLLGLLDQFDARQALHVTYGSVLDRLGERLLAMLWEHEEVHYMMLEVHFQRHLSSFTLYAKEGTVNDSTDNESHYPRCWVRHKALTIH